MEFRVLGPIELWSAGRQRDLGPARERCVLAILLLTPRTIVPAETLIDRLWDTRPPAKARESLSAYLARLRASLRQAVGDSVQLAGRARGYMLDVDPEAVDLHQFRRLRRRADTLAASGDHDQAATLLREADGLWRGPALAGIDGDWVARMRDSLEEERRAAILERVECELALGRHADLVGELHHLLAQYPLDETFIAHQMTALYRSGRPGDALGLYRETRGRLVEEQGTEPGRRCPNYISGSSGAIPELAGKPAARQPARVSPRTPSRPGSRPDTLPPETADFVGRDEELSLLIGEQGDAPRVSVIVGMPGVGKTALAVHAARILSGQYPDGVLYLNFHSHDPGSPSLDAAEALYRLLQMLTVPATQIPESPSERAALWRAQLSRRRAVVILDDTASLDQIGPLLPAGGRSLILVTSRYRIPGPGGCPGADPGRAARRRRGRAVPADRGRRRGARRRRGGRGRGTVRAPAARHPAHRRPAGPGLPAAARRPGGGAVRTRLPASRARSVTALDWVPAFELSYRALQPGHQEFFRRLGLSPATQISLHAAAALGGVSLAEAEEAIGALLDHHLLSPAPGGQFVFHDLIRGYAAMCAERDEPASVRRQSIGRLLDYYLHTADQADRELYPFRRRMPVSVTRPPAAVPALATQEEAAAWLEAEWRNILQAAQYAARHEWKRKCADLIHALAGFVQIKAYWDEAIAAHSAGPAGIPRHRGSGQDRAGGAGTLRGEPGDRQARGDASRWRRTPRRSTGPRPTGAARRMPSTRWEWPTLRTSRYREALAYFHEARILYRAAGDEHGVADTLSHSGITCWHLGRHPDATDHLGEALSLYREAGDRRGEAKTLNNLGRMQLLSGYHRDALDGLSKFAEDIRRDRRGAERGDPVSQHRLRLRLQGQLRGGARRLPPGPGHFPRDRRPAQPGRCAQ